MQNDSSPSKETCDNESKKQNQHLGKKGSYPAIGENDKHVAIYC